MPIKIICLEEHTVDAELAKAIKPAVARLAPYMAGLGSVYQDQPDEQTDTLPHLQSPTRVMELVTAAVDDRLAVMDRHGIDMQVLSHGQQAQAAPVAEAARLTRAANDRLAEAAARHPDRFAGFSTLPWQDPDAAVLELERSFRDLGLKGTLLAGYPAEDALIDDARYTSVLAKFAELKLPLYIHPGPPLPAVQQPYYSGFNKDVTARFSLYGWGWHNEAGIQVIRLILSGALDRYPDLRIISGHWGEMVPFFLQRMDDALPPEVTGLKRTVSQTYRDQVYITPSGMLNLPHFRFVHEVLGAERILFAVDHPYLTMTGARAWLEALPVNEAERALIAHGNAERLLGL